LFTPLHFFVTFSFVNRGDKVRVLDNSSRGSTEKLGDCEKDVEIIIGDIRDPKVVRSAVKGMDQVHHLAFVNGTEYFYKYPH
jgi:nucleoside-diphosphate-sugar epimerase